MIPEVIIILLLLDTDPNFLVLPAVLQEENSISRHTNITIIVVKFFFLLFELNYSTQKISFLCTGYKLFSKRLVSVFVVVSFPSTPTFRAQTSFFPNVFLPQYKCEKNGGEMKGRKWKNNNKF